MAKIDWTQNQETIKQILQLRDEGLSFGEISKQLRQHGRLITRNQARHVVLTYGVDKELDEEVSKRNILSARRSQNAARLANKNVRDVADLALSQEAALEAINNAIKQINKAKVSPLKATRTKTKSDKGKMTIELLFSDWQIGKTMNGYDSKVAIKRLREYADRAIKETIRRGQEGFFVEKIVLVLLGDIIESAEKAVGKNSARSVDTSTAEQMQLSIKHLFLDLLRPLEETGIPIHVVGVTGNHDHIHPGMIYYNPGKEHLTWTIYKSLELICQECEMSVSFDIPEGYFATYSYYGQKALYEHGYGLAATEAALNTRRNERMRQKKEYYHYFRMGDKHNICRFNDDSLVVNGAFFGNDDTGSEYSSIVGYSSVASQIMFFHVPRKDERKTIYDSFSIQLHHIK